MSNINLNEIPAGTTVSVTGFVDFSHIKTQIAGEELAANNARAVQRGSIPIDKPHTQMTIKNCHIDYENPSVPTEAEKFIAEKIYVSAKHPEKGPCLTAVNKSSVLPNTYVRDNEQSMTLERLALDGELAPDVPVTIYLRFFKAQRNTGVSLDTVIVNTKPVKYYSSNGEASLVARGFKIIDCPDVDAQTIAAQIDAQPVPTAAPYMTQPAVAQPVQPTPAPTAASYVQPQVVPTPVATPAQAVPTAMPYQAAQPTDRPIPPAGYMYNDDGKVVPIPPAGITL